MPSGTWGRTGPLCHRSLNCSCLLCLSLCLWETGRTCKPPLPHGPAVKRAGWRGLWWCRPWAFPWCPCAVRHEEPFSLQPRACHDQLLCKPCLHPSQPPLGTLTLGDGVSCLLALPFTCPLTVYQGHRDLQSRYQALGMVPGQQLRCLPPLLHVDSLPSCVSSLRSHVQLGHSSTDWHRAVTSGPFPCNVGEMPGH